MTIFDRPSEVEVEVRPEIETNIDLPDIPIDQTRTVDELQLEARIEKCVDSIRKDLRLEGQRLNNDIYRKLTMDKDGYLYYDNKRLTSKRGGNSHSLLALSTLQKSQDGREFLDMLGYDPDRTHVKTIVKTAARDLETVAPEQATVIKAKMDSFRATETWAKKAKEKAKRQMEQTTDATERQKYQDIFSNFEQMEQQAKSRYNEVASSQLKRVNEIVNDKSRSLGERLKELFRRDGVTLGAIITAIGMTISTIVLSVLPGHAAAAAPSGGSAPKPQSKVKQVFVKLANWLLDLAKKAALAVPGALGSLISMLFKKTAQAVLFLSEHLILLFLAVLLAAAELIFVRKRR